jgi:hypothetical protein
MGVIACPGCGAIIDAEAATCPKCGGDPQAPASFHTPRATGRRVSVLGGLALCVAVLGVFLALIPLVGFSFLGLPLVAIGLGALAYVRAERRGGPTGLAVAAIVIGVVTLALFPFFMLTLRFTD